MSYQIYQWKDIESIFLKSNILLGNGASIAVSNSFNYSSLKEVASSSSLIQEEESLFDFFETNDFEQILKIVWQASNVNKILKVKDKKTQNIYHKIRDSLIKAVHQIHPNYNEISDDIINISNFLQKFNIIVSLNYDLIIYWAILYANEQNNQFTDCFLYGKFDFDNNSFCKFYNEKIKVFYPHGNLILAYDKILNEVKLQTNSNNLIKSIINEWNSENYNPLFISEGSSQQKINAIQRSNYLNTVYKNILPELIRINHFSNYRFPEYSLNKKPSYSTSTYIEQNLKEYNTIVIYGFGFGTQDKHILKQIFQKISSDNITCLAISVYNNDMNYCNNIISRLEKYKKNLHIYFFDSQSSGCWNNA
jgi:hypothetical protein